MTITCNKCPVCGEDLMVDDHYMTTQFHDISWDHRVNIQFWMFYCKNGHSGTLYSLSCLAERLGITNKEASQ